MSDGLVHKSLNFDYRRIDILQIKFKDWHSIVVILYVYSYNYIRFQCAYDVASGDVSQCVSSYKNKIWYRSIERNMYKINSFKVRLICFPFIIKHCVRANIMI